MSFKQLLFFTLTIATLSFGQSHAQSPRKVRITVLVHGIMSIKPHLTLPNLWRFLRDKVEDTLYSETVSQMRQDPFFFENQAMQEIGFHKIDVDRIEKGYASGLVGRLLNEVEQIVDPHTTYENHYYSYGWQGLLSARIRYLEAIPLYNDLIALVQEFRAQGIEPEIRLIGYSHGGNLCLNLGAVRQNEEVNPHLTINELILLGVPVQCETDFLINDPIFTRVYQIYSRGDRIQKLDFFSTKRFFSRRVFKSRKYFALPKKLTQIQIRMTRSVRRKRHKEIPKHCYNINDVSILSGKSKHLRDISPGHIELWFFGWTPSNYRPHFAISPLPLLIFLPLIIRTTEDTITRAQTPNTKKPIIMDLRPEFQHIIVKNQKSWKNITITEFFDKATMQTLIDMCTPYIPDNYTLEEYEYHIEQAMERAEELFEQKYHTPCSCKKQCHKAHRRKPFIKSMLIS